MRLLAVGNLYPPQHLGGYELAWQAAMARARAEGLEVTILTREARLRADAADTEPGVHRRLRGYWDPATHAFAELSARERLALERHNHAALSALLARARPDVISWWSMGTLSLSLIERVRAAGIPALLVVHDGWLLDGPRSDAWIRAWAARPRALGALAARASGVPTRVDLPAAGPIVFNSEHVRAAAGAGGVDTARSQVIHPGVEQRFLTGAPGREWEWRLAYVGRIDPAKGIDTAIAAVAQLPEATLTVWGAGDEGHLASLRALAARLGVGQRVRFAGFASGAQRYGAYAEADAILFPARWQEPFGLVPLEAMGVGRPVLATAQGGSAEYLRDGDNALVCAPDDPAALAAGVRRLAGEPELRARLREHGAATAAGFTARRFAAETVAAIRAAASVAPAARR